MADATKNLRELFDKIAKEHNFISYDVKIRPISSGGANYTSQLYLATISNGSEELKLFAKVIILGEKIRLEGLGNIFDTEPFVYTQLSKIYRQLEEKHKVPEEHRLKFPKFYGHNPAQGEEILVLEDLAAKGYSVYDRFKSMDWSYAFKATKELAKLHALSFAFQQELPEEFEKALTNLEMPFVDNENVKNMMTASSETACSVLDDKKRWRLESFLSKVNMNAFLEYMKPLRRPVLVHGDFRMSNLMHKVDDEGLYDLKILDYQTMKGGSPVLDLIYFIVTGTDEEFRAKHYLPLLDHYYSQLSLAMRRLGLKPKDIYSRDDFDFELQNKLPYGLMLAMFVLPLITVEQDDAPIMDKDKDFSAFKIDKLGKLYPERMNGVINDYIKWGVL